MEMPSFNNKKKEKFDDKIIILIRHGERADLAGLQVKMHISDPELTEEGKTQAFETGKRLKEILEEEILNNKKIALISSPFSRTLMTAKYVKNGLDLNLPINIENGLSEFLSKSWFKNNPKDFLEFFNANEILMQELMHDVIINNSLNVLPDFPESTHSCIERFRTTLDLIIYYYLLTKNFDVVILITHVFGLQTLCEKMEIPLDFFDIEYCSTFIFKLNVELNKFSFEKNFHPILYK